jgi:hypothetical protein
MTVLWVLQGADALVGSVIDDLVPSDLRSSEGHHPAVVELSTYLIESVGNSTRIDYGTGHELAFIAFLCCLFQLGILTPEDSVATVTKTFQRYSHR